MSDMIKRLLLAVILVVSSGALLVAHATTPQAQADTDCACPDLVLDPPCVDTAPNGTFECDDYGDGWICYLGDWVPCETDDYLDPYCGGGEDSYCDPSYIIN